MKLAVYIAICFLYTFPFNSLAKQTMTAGWELWYPYQYHNKDSQLVGLDIDSFKAIMKEAGLQFSIDELPWKRHIQYISTGNIDMAMGASKTPEREKFAYFSHPYRKETVKLYVRKGEAKNIQIQTLNDLIGSKYFIGVEGGYYYGKQYQELIKNPDFQLHINEVVDIEQNVTMVLEGHLDGFLVDPFTMSAFVKKYNMQNEFEEHPVVIYSANIYIMLSKKSTDKTILNKINAAINTLKNNGKLNEIIDNWSELQH